MINTDVKVPMVFFQMDAATRMHPPLDEITDAMLTSKHPEILSALWNIDKDANPALDKFKGLALKGFDTVSWSPSTTSSKPTILWTALSITWRTHQGRRPLHRHHFRRRHCCRAAEKNSGKITGQVGDLVVWNIERVYENLTEGTGQMVDVYVRRSDRFFANT
jgi:hypothetical protein